MLAGEVSSVSFTFKNKCDATVWVGVLSNNGMTPLKPTGFSLQKGESRVLHAPSSYWGGKFWGRTNCSQDSVGKFKCATGDCGPGKIECAGASATPPATLIEFTINGDVGSVFFDVSLVHGFNIPVLVSSSGGSGRNCTSAGCTADLNGRCPSELKVVNSEGEVVACKSACLAFGQQQEYCLKPSFYSQLFKTACPHSSTYADDLTATVTCTGAEYNVTFCPTSTTRKNSKEKRQTPTAPRFNTSTLYDGKHATGNTNIGAIIGVVVGIIAAIIIGNTVWRCVTGDISILNGSCNCNWC
ncbi:putative Thaumatin family [Helianthus debilis subsp. tardiflorus]